MSDEQQAGRALDAEVSRVVFGAPTQTDHEGTLWEQDGGIVPWFSENTADAWLVAEAMLGRRVGNLVVVGMDVSAARYDLEEPPSYTCTATLATPLDAPLDGTTAFCAAEETSDTAALAIARSTARQIASAAIPEAAEREAAS